MSASFPVMQAGSAAAGEPAPKTRRGVAHRGGTPNETANRLTARFPNAVVRSEVVWGDTTVYVRPDSAKEVLQWLHDDAGEQYDYLVDVTAVEYRDPEQPIEVVWHLRSLPYRRFLRVKAELDKAKPLQITSVWSIWKSADWLERECYDMFGIEFVGHPDLRRILLWEQFKEGNPLRKDFPLRGRFSRAEQLRQALAANPEARYSMEELSIADAFESLPLEMRKRVSSGERTGE